MKKTVAALSLFFISNLVLAQASPKLIKGNFNVERNSGGSVRILKSSSIDQYAASSKDKCLAYTAKQYQSLTAKNDKAFQTAQNSIGTKLKQRDHTCRYFRFELIDAITDQGSTSTSSKQFTYRCYETADFKLSDARVIQVKPHVINPMNLKDSPTDDEEDAQIVKSKCDFFEIAKKLERNLDNAPVSSKASTSKKVKTNN